MHAMLRSRAGEAVVVIPNTVNIFKDGELERGLASPDTWEMLTWQNTATRITESQNIESKIPKRKYQSCKLLKA